MGLFNRDEAKSPPPDFQEMLPEHTVEQTISNYAYNVALAERINTKIKSAIESASQTAPEKLINEYKEQVFLLEQALKQQRISNADTYKNAREKISTLELRPPA